MQISCEAGTAITGCIRSAGVIIQVSNRGDVEGEEGVFDSLILLLCQEGKINWQANSRCWCVI